MTEENNDDAVVNSNGGRDESSSTEIPLKIAVAGCSHGEMDTIYDTLARWEHEHNFKTDLLICCGDYESVRNYADLETMACPPKYRSLHNFHRYYSGEIVAPVLTVFIGGNHEATSFLTELPYGGWVAKNIWYMGYAGCVRFRGLRIAGLSGIYKYHDYNRGHYEVTPFDDSTMRSAYHVRSLEVFRLKQLAHDNDERKRLDVHDWPTGITKFGDERWLLQRKKHFQEDVAKNQLGNPFAEQLLDQVQPRNYFAAHLHVRFEAQKRHVGTDFVTEFLALDKPLPRRQFLETLNMVQNNSDSHADYNGLCYDPQWLAVLRSTDHLWHLKSSNNYMPSSGTSSSERHDFRPTDDELAAVDKLFNGDYRIPLNFRQTGPPHQPHETAKMFRNCQSLNYRNPQTTEFCTKLGVLDVNRCFCEMSPADHVGQPYYLIEGAITHNEMPTTSRNSAIQPSRLVNPDSIQLDFDESFVKASTLDTDNAYFGDADFLIDRRNPKEHDIVIEPFLVPPIKQQRISDERELASEHKVDVASGDSATTTTVDGKPGIVGALGKMRRRNAMEYATREDSDSETVK